MEPKKVRRYDAEFKREAVRLVEEEGRTVVQVARSLGLRAETLRRWQERVAVYPENPFPGPGRPRRQAENEGRELAQLQAETERLRRERDQMRRQRDSARMDRDILKKALAIFSEPEP